MGLSQQIANLVAREKQVPIIRKFKGLNRFAALSNCPPDYALDLLNVIINGGGGLEKFRLPLLIKNNNNAYGSSPARLYDFQQGNGTRLLVQMLGSTVVTDDINANFAPDTAQNDASFNFLWDVVTSNNIGFMANGNVMRKYIAPAIGFAHVKSWGAPFPNSQLTQCAVVDNGAGALTFVNGGRRYGISFSSSITGHETNVTPLSASTGNVAGRQFQVSGGVNDVTADDLYDTVNLYSTLDGGGDLFYNKSQAYPHNNTIPVINDNTLDSALVQSRRGALINDPPLVGKFLCEWAGRIFVFNLVGSPQDIIYSGMERIFVGRPEESFPPQNRMRLALGADAIAGGSVIQAGVIAFSRGDKMFMFRGIPEDITSSAPVLYSAYLEELPWNVGCFSHYSIAQTPYGVVWLATDKTVQVFSGIGQPITISAPIHSLMKTITPGTEGNCRGCYYNWLDREWYILACSLGGSAVNNALFFFDMNADPELNAGIFYSNIQADDITIVEDMYAQRHLMVLREGNVFDLQVESDVDGGISIVPRAPTSGKLTAFWQSGYFGNEDAERRKMFRYARLIADAGDFTIEARLVDDRDYKFTNPFLKMIRVLNGKASINRKARRCSLKINFPNVDADANVIELESFHIATSKQ